MREIGTLVCWATFKPVRQFEKNEGDFFDITRRLKRDDELGMMKEDYYGRQKHPYSHKEFYAASTNKTADIFFCLETMKQYVPCENEMQEYVTEPEKKQDRGKTR